MGLMKFFSRNPFKAITGGVIEKTIINYFDNFEVVNLDEDSYEIINIDDDEYEIVEVAD